MFKLKLAVPTASIIAYRKGSPFDIVVLRSGEKHNGKLVLPGGCLEAGDEKYEDCAKRELTEETGLHGVHFEFLFLEDNPGRDVRELPLKKFVEASGDDVPEISVTACYCSDMVYSCEVVGEPFAKDSEAKEVFFVDARGIDPEDFAVGHGEYVRRWVLKVEKMNTP